MSNIISFNGKVLPDDDSLQMSNGRTDVFINILALIGSVIARTKSEKRFMVCLSEKDQIIGRGCVGHVYCGFPRCKKHNTFLTCFGCQICNS